MSEKTKLSSEEIALFRQAMKGVKPLKSTNKNYTKPQKKARPIKNTNINESVRDTCSFYPEQVHHKVKAETYLQYFPNNFPPKMRMKLKQGQFPIDDRCDLHGQDRHRALINTQRFIKQALERAKRCVLIIHGKGQQRGNYASLKSLIYAYLLQHSEIQCFCSASPRHGGTGALYVVLKKSPNSSFQSN